MKNSKLDWKGVGQFLAVLVQIWTIIKGVVENKVGIEILDWFVGDGKACFTEWLQTLIVKYRKSLPLELKRELLVDFESATLVPCALDLADQVNQIKSRVRGKRKFSEIGVSIHAKGVGLSGYDLLRDLEGQEVLGAQLLDFYLEHPDLIDWGWKNKGWIFFWGTVYYSPASLQWYVRGMRFDGFTVEESRVCLLDAWEGDYFVAVSASSGK